ncbi:type I restriction endonuclease subunit R, EcoR124 family [Selenomonas ruminantium]
MVICSPIEMRYFATPKSKDRFNLSFAFHWTDKENNPVNNWECVVDNFLRVPMAHQIIGDYLVIYAAENQEDRCHLLMRPYQVYALQAVELASIGHDEGSGGIAHGGVVWHTTGSGKTITSFKTALFLSTRVDFDKIVFMVDRRELDSNTSKRFKEYAKYEPVTVDDSPSTYALSKKFKEPGIVVTTTFKVHNLVKKLIETGDERLKEKRIVFIIDEAHRTTVGDMMVDIKKFFQKKGLFYGFTGTPLFDENHAKGKVNKESEVIMTTERLFGPLLHKYTIDEAIADKNVLSFHVKYINTSEFKGYEDLRDKLAEALAADKEAGCKINEAEEIVAGWDDLKVEQEAEKRKLFVYQDETHIPRVVEHILSNWEAQSQGKFFNAILTVAYKKRVLAYYKEFKKQLAKQDNPIHVAMTISFGNPNSPDRLEKEFVEEMFADYEKFTNVSFTAGDQKRGEDAYYEDLTERGGSGRGYRNIDLIIVADQMLTGWDDKYLNTLYNDRLQGLIQAYSRTNRVLGSRKEFGTIINYMRPKESERAVNDALSLYDSGGQNSPAYVGTYDVAVEKLKARVEKMRSVLPNPTEWQTLEKDEEGTKAFLKVFKAASSQKHKVEQYYEFLWDDDRFGITQDMWLNYVGAYKNLRPDSNEPEMEIISLPGRLKIVGTAEITAAYIIELVGKKTKTVDGVRVIDEESMRIILEKIHQLSNRGEKRQAEILTEFLGDIKDG